MERKREVVSYVVKYNSNSLLFTGNHKPDIRDLLLTSDTDKRVFTNQGEAIVFLTECTSPITKIEDLVPELKGMKKFNYLLPDRNIRPKHQLQSSMDYVLEGEG